MQDVPFVNQKSMMDTCILVVGTVLDVAKYCRYDFLVTEKTTKWLINGVVHSFELL